MFLVVCNNSPSVTQNEGNTEPVKKSNKKSKKLVVCLMITVYQKKIRIKITIIMNNYITLGNMSKVNCRWV